PLQAPAASRFSADRIERRTITQRDHLATAGGDRLHATPAGDSGDVTVPRRGPSGAAGFGGSDPGSELGVESAHEALAPVDGNATGEATVRLHHDIVAFSERDDAALPDNLAPDIVAVSDVDRGFDCNQCARAHFDQSEQRIGEAIPAGVLARRLNRDSDGL